MKKELIIRDDDMPQNISIEHLDKIHQLFLKYNKIHTAVILAEELDRNLDFVHYLNTHHNFDIVLHGWTHSSYPDLSDESIREHLTNSFKAFKKHFNMVPTMWYLPWNGWTKEKEFRGVPRIREIAKEFNLEVNEVSEHISVSIRGENHTGVCYFHHWEHNCIENLTNLFESEK